mgnify:FL=1
MRKVIIIIIALFCMLPIADAQNIVGKWKCSKGFLEGLNMRFSNMRGKYKFKKDSTFVAKIRGGGGAYIIIFSRKYSIPRPALYIKVKGTYSITNGTITTIVKPENVHCDIESGQSAPVMPTVYDAGRRGLDYYEMEEATYRRDAGTAKRQEETIKNEYMHVWNWKKEPIALNGNTLTIGDKATFTK